MMNQRDELVLEAQELRDAVQELAKVANSLDIKLGSQDIELKKTISKQKNIINGLLISLLLHVLITCYLAWSYQRITNVQERTSNTVLCPLYKIFLDSYNPKAQPPERLPQYEEAFVVLRDGYATLECRN